ncbi:MAG: FMN-binding negative transcriptional regulator [Gammaproteobacteria bacterium]|nr:FMN-binding negative transcriptional regulator [Gammaproteobacteria bacterium]
MYVPSRFEEPRLEIMHELIRANPLATVVTLSSAGLNANHIPLYLSEEPAPFGILRGHVARSNPIWNDYAKDVDVLAIFHGPQAYISPSWCATKKETGKVVPTWNYAVVHAYGSLSVMDDASWLRVQLDALTDRNEAAVSEQWQVSDAPREYTEKMIGAVVGIEIVITKLIGKWKTSVIEPEQNLSGVIHELAASGQQDAASMAVLMEERGKRVR